jgi:hypothetical protein
MYGDDEDYSSSETSRPLSFIASPYGGEQLEKFQKQQQTQPQSQAYHSQSSPRSQHSGALSPSSRPQLLRSQSDLTPATLSASPTQERSLGSGAPNHASNGNYRSNSSNSSKKPSMPPARMPSQRSGSFEGSLKSPLPPLSPLSPHTPTPSLREFKEDSDGSKFPLSNMDDPSSIAQELSNLQALRRMSMDVGNNSDPDLLPFSGISLVEMPSIAPMGDDDEADPSRLLWVPARVHPELEPTAFKDFLEDRVQAMKRRSGDSMLSVEGLDRMNSGGGLQRKKSMLSRQVNRDPDSYSDGADRLGRIFSQGEQSLRELSLEELVKNPSKAVQKLTQDTIPEEGAEGDRPILKVAPGQGLRRSTRTQYRKGGSLRSRDRVPFAKRMAGARSQLDGNFGGDEEGDIPAMPSLDASGNQGATQELQRVQSEPALADGYAQQQQQAPSQPNYSRPTKSVRRQQPFVRDGIGAGPTSPQDGQGASLDSLDGSTADDSASSMSAGPEGIRPHAPAPGASSTVPQIISTPPVEERQYPARISSQKTTTHSTGYNDQPAQDNRMAQTSRQPAGGRPGSSPASINSTAAPENSNLSDIAHRPSPLPGGGASRTDSLTFIPTFTTPEDKKAADRKSREKDENEGAMASIKSSGWKWFKSEKEKKKKDEEELAKRSKGKDKAHDNARLDLIQNSIDHGGQRESLVLEHDEANGKLSSEADRGGKKEANRKSAESTKKEKDGFFGGLFGGKKKSGDKDPSHKKSKDLRPVTPEPPVRRRLVPDVDYHFTRFPITEERAIYRMAHLKLANPRRPLFSQVLLSNFMYSYLAKVQAMHPNIQVPMSPQQRKAEEDRKRREAEQQALMMEQQMLEGGDDGQDDYDFEYHRVRSF